jgi:hypothetical protein
LVVLPAMTISSRMLTRRRPGRPPEPLEVLTLRVHGPVESWTVQDATPFDPLEPKPNTWRLLS